MGIASRLFTASYSAFCTAAGLALGYGAVNCLSEAFNTASAGRTGDAILDAALGVAAVGGTLMSAAGIVFFAKETISPEI